MILGNFGFATFDGDNLKTSRCGTDGYKPPEAFWSPEGDIYSLGTTMYMMTQGALQYDETRSYLELPDEHHSKELGLLVMRCTNKRPETRPLPENIVLDLAEMIVKGGAGREEKVDVKETVIDIKTRRKTKPEKQAQSNSAKSLKGDKKTNKPRRAKAVEMTLKSRT